ncbi:MAG: amino acid kinase [Thermoplasmata archaeon]|nr:MAG: amino acid kinase [Thermoplasmata archaeon]
MIILKLGGSLLTDKRKRFSIKRNILRRVVSEIKESGKRVIVVHGGGSFGHPIAKEYQLDRGLFNSFQLLGVALTRSAMQKFNSLIVDEFISQGMKPISIQTSAIVICKKRRISSFNYRIVDKFFSHGFTPILYGDVVLDEEMGFCICSGDQLIIELAKKFNPDMVVLATDVDGVFDKDPKKYKDAKLIEKISIRDIDKVKFYKIPTDVTGGIKSKIEELARLAEDGYNSIIINAKVRGRLKKALLGQKVKGTRIEGEK